MMKRWMLFGTTFLLTMALVAWNSGGEKTATQDDDVNHEIQVTPSDGHAKEGEKSQVVTLKDTEGNAVATANLTQENDGVHVSMDVDGLPEGTHAFHVHEKGVCEPPDFESAGGHYNPTDMKHGKLNPEGPHAGDFDNIEVDESGKAHVEFTTTQITLEHGKETTLYTDEGTSLVIHADPDDYKSQPAGDAGDRIACGVIDE